MSADTPDTVAWNDSPNSSPEIVTLEADLEALNRLRSASDLERRVGNQLLELDRLMTASDHEGYLHQSACGTLIRNLILQKRAKHDQKLLNTIEALHGIDNNPAHPAQLTGHQLDVELQMMEQKRIAAGMKPLSTVGRIILRHSIIIKRQAEIDAEQDHTQIMDTEVEDEVKRIKATLPEPLSSEKRQVLKVASEYLPWKSLTLDTTTSYYFENWPVLNRSSQAGSTGRWNRQIQPIGKPPVGRRI
ncbi:hypothetical protein C8J56DRAFT_1066407 [Mycena floridula]|nr:hypothetical protein C8J56DRAFT_1066407 [Mycena floridula]